MRRTLVLLALVLLASPSTGQPVAGAPYRLVMLDPGNARAALLQQKMHPQIDPLVHVYAPRGDDVREHLKRIDAYNRRSEGRTSWRAKTYTGPDFLDRLVREKPGNVVILSGNNRGKAQRILRLVDAGMHVLADNPVVIEPDDFESLREAFALAKARGVLIYEMMTARSPIATVLQREFARMPEIFGVLEMGSAENPAVVMESAHHFRKTVSGEPLKRPAWFFDVTQQGEALADVAAHLVDLVQWTCFPEQAIDYPTEIAVLSARRWPITISAAQYRQLTGLRRFPDFLRPNITDGGLQVFANGEISYRLKGVHVRVTARWNHEAPAGGGDTHYSLLRGTKCTLVVRQGAAEKFKPTLYLEAAPGTDPIGFRRLLAPAMVQIQRRYPGVDVKPLETSWQVTVPEELETGHESHLAALTERFLEYVRSGRLPAWEEPNMLAKYYTTTKALEIARTER